VLDTYYFKSEPKPFGYTFEGRAIKTETRKHPGRPEGLALARPV
jgi:hypothetical protein